MLISLKRSTYNGRLIGNHIWPIKWQQRQWPWMTLKIIHRLQAFSNSIRRTFVQHFTRFQLTVCSHGSSALAELFVTSNALSFLTIAQCQLQPEWIAYTSLQCCRPLRASFAMHGYSRHPHDNNCRPSLSLFRVFMYRDIYSYSAPRSPKPPMQI